MNTNTLLLILLLLQIKHLIVDWCWQPEYEWKNKGTYGHPGGMRHAIKNAIGTAICFCFFVDPMICLGILMADGVVHYHIDWAKMTVNRLHGLDANRHPQFWYLTGLDQALHQITYLLICWCVIS